MLDSKDFDAYKRKFGDGCYYSSFDVFKAGMKWGVEKYIAEQAEEAEVDYSQCNYEGENILYVVRPDRGYIKTICILIGGLSDNVYFGSAMCSPSSTFNVTRGREIAFGRMRKCIGYRNKQYGKTPDEKHFIKWKMFDSIGDAIDHIESYRGMISNKHADTIVNFLRKHENKN